MRLKTSIVQWNIRGVHNKKQEIIHILEQNQASIVALQETLMPIDRLHKIPNYSVFAKDGVHNRRQHGGVALYIRNDVPKKEITLTTSLQAVAATVQLKKQFTICNIYNSRSHTLTANLLHQLYSELPKPCIIVGDFNAYSPLWGCASTDARGRAVETFINTSDLILMNNGTPTHPNINNDSAIDLSLCSPAISLDFEWNVIPSLYDSDHFPITLTTEITEPDPSPIRLIKKADWNLFHASQAWNNLPQELPTNDETLKIFYERMNTACNEAIPQTVPSKFFPKPWWTPELTLTRSRRERFYQIYRRTRNLQAGIRWRKARAEHKNLVRLSKEKSWKEYISEFNEELPISEICKRVKKMKGTLTRNIRALCNGEEPNEVYSTPSQIAEELAKQFSKVSSNNNYTAEFLAHKHRVEENPPNFGSSTAAYNRNFTLTELNHVLANVKDSSPGEDGVVYKMVKNMPHRAKEFLLKMFNKFFQESYFPPAWCTSVIIPVPKPGKNQNLATSYRPIALTSCLCKLMERLINERLMEFFIMHKVLTPMQSGGVRNRSTVDHLVRLEDTIRTAFASQEHFISIFFDLEKAYDMTWRGGIIADLFQIGLRGSLPKSIASFLNTRSFRVKVGNVFSQEHPQENGVPQGAVLSVLLFALKINSIIEDLPISERFTCSLFVDDLQIGFRHPDLNTIKNTLQTVLNKLNAWTLTNGFKFSSSKTQVVHFSKLRGIHLPPTLKLGGETLQYSNCAKFLGLHFDSKLSWNIHINKLKHDSQKLLGIMKMLTSLEYGATQQSLLKIYRIYIRSKLDYGSIVYSSASMRDLKSLDVVCNDAIRIATGAFKSSPIDSLYALVNEPPPSERRDLLSIRYYLKLKASLNNPANRCITNRSEIPFRTHNEHPFFIRITDIKTKYNLPSFIIKPEFSYIIHNCKTPKYAIPNPTCNKELSSMPKSSTNPSLYKIKLRELIDRKYGDFNKVFTDGSKSNNGVGAAAIVGGSSCSASLPIEASIFSAELHAIQMAIDSIQRTVSTQRKFVLFTDSKSCLDALHNQSNHPTIRYMTHKLHILKSLGYQIELCWIPSHVGIEGNERADKKAGEAAKRRPETIPIFYKDYFSTIQSKFTQKRTQNWQDSPQPSKLRNINPELTVFPPTYGLTRREEVILNRIRIGHTNFSHSHLMENMPPTVCHYCNNALLTVNHIFTQCPRLEVLRRLHFGSLNNWNLQIMVGTNADPYKIVKFLKSIKLSNHV